MGGRAAEAAAVPPSGAWDWEATWGDGVDMESSGLACAVETPGLNCHLLLQEIEGRVSCADTRTVFSLRLARRVSRVVSRMAKEVIERNTTLDKLKHVGVY